MQPIVIGRGGPLPYRRPMLNRGKDKKQSYLPVRSPSPQPSASARGSAPPLQRRQSPAPDQKRPKQQKNTIAPGQVRAELQEAQQQLQLSLARIHF